MLDRDLFPSLIHYQDDHVDISGRTERSRYHSRDHKRNEDVIGFIPGTSPTIFILDGSSHMGLGYPASRRVARFLDKNLRNLPDSISERVDVIEQMVKEASSDLMKGLPEARTTATIMTTTREGKYRYLGIVHVGDSRGYLEREGQLVQITDDDNLVNFWRAPEWQKRVMGELVEIGIKSKRYSSMDEDTEFFVNKQSYVVQMLGHDGSILWDQAGKHFSASETLAPHTYILTVTKGDTGLLTTDGVHRSLGRQDMSNYNDTNLLVHAAWKAGSNDDRSAIRMRLK